ncbi:MAG: hypothetical protein ACREAD_04505 [Nitrosopumilaceae archaeon]
MKTLHLSIIAIAGIMITSTSLAFADQNPIIITQVELWGPTSFYTDGVKLCGYDGTSFGPWALGWIELYNTKNETISIDDVGFVGQGSEGSYMPIMLGPHEYCYLVTQNHLNTRDGVGGSLGNDAPLHDNSTIILSYSIQPFAGKTIYNYSTPKLSDDFGDTRTWQLVDGNWIFKEANIKHEFPTKTILLSPSKQIQSSINVKDLKCKEGFVVVVKKSDPTNQYLQDFPSCMTPSSASKLVDRGWGVPEQTMPIQNTNSTVTYYVEGSKIDQIMPDLITRGLTLNLETTGDSKMTLFLPRSFVDSPEIGDYASFNVTANGNKIDYDEHLTPTDRMFVILFPNGTKSIEIVPLVDHGQTKEIVTQTSQSTTLPASFELCNTPYKLKEGFIPVLYMPANSLGKICVNYSNPNNEKNASLAIFEASAHQPAKYEFSSVQPAKSITTWAEPSVIPIGNSTEVYFVKTGNQTGFYGLTVYCVGMPLAVGYDNQSNITLNYFPWMKQTATAHCLLQDYISQVVGVDGIGIKYISPNP